MFFDENRDNTLYENMVVDDDLKQQMLKACMEAKEKSSCPDIMQNPLQQVHSGFCVFMERLIYS